MSEKIGSGLEKINRKTLKRVAESFMELDGVEDVEVFGSLARGDEGNDIDMIIVVDRDKEQDFYARMKNILAGEYSREDYYRLAGELFAGGEEVMRKADKTTQNRLNILVHAPDWRERASEIQEEGFHHDPDFLNNISRDAISVSELD